MMLNECKWCCQDNDIPDNCDREKCSTYEAYQQGIADERERIIREIQNVGNRYCTNVHCDMECINCEHGCLMRAIVKIVRGGENE